MPRETSAVVPSTISYGMFDFFIPEIFLRSDEPLPCELRSDRHLVKPRYPFSSRSAGSEVILKYSPEEISIS